MTEAVAVFAALGWALFFYAAHRLHKARRGWDEAVATLDVLSHRVKTLRESRTWHLNELLRKLDSERKRRYKLETRVKALREEGRQRDAGS